MLPQMGDPSVRSHHIAGLNSGWAIANILLFHDRGRLTDAAHRGSISSMALGTSRRIALIGSGPLGFYNSVGDRAMALAGILAAVEALDKRASLHVFR